MAMMTQNATAECQEKGHNDFLLDPGKYTQCTKYRKLISVRIFSLKFEVESCTCAKARHCSVESSGKYMTLF